MKQSFAYRVLAVDAQQQAARIAEIARGNGTDQDNDDWMRRHRAREQELSRQLYALARARVNEAHGWEAIEP